MKNALLRAMGAPALLLFASTAAQAQSLVASNTTAGTGEVNHTSTISYTPGADSGSFDFILTFDDTNLTTTVPEITPNIPNGTTVCNIVVQAGDDQILCNATANSAAVDLGAGTITILFDVGPTAGVEPLTFAQANFFAQTGATEPGTTTNGSITVQAVASPSVTYTPAQDPDGTSDATPEVVFPAGGTGTTASSSITFDGTGGTAGQNTVVGPCSISGSGGITINPPFSNVTINSGDPAGDVDGTITLSCTYSGAGPQTNVLSCTEDGSIGAPVTRLWDVSCPQGGSTPPTIAYNPNFGTQINFQGTLAQVVNQSISVTETAQGQAGSSVVVGNCAITGAGAAAFGPVTGQPITINGGPPSQSGSLGLSCTIPAASASATLTCDETTSTGVGAPTVAQRTWPLQCLAPSPEFNSNPAENTVVGLTALPGSTATRSIAVTNSGFAPLNVSGCNITGPDAANFGVPTVTGSPIAPQGSGSINLSCTAPAAQGATFNATLTCTTDDPTDGEDVVTWPLQCTSVILSIPTMGLWGKVALGLGVLALGLFGFAMRRRFQ
jgi:hypothetical protein